MSMWDTSVTGRDLMHICQNKFILKIFVVVIHVHLLERQGKRDLERIFHSLVHSPTTYDDLSLARPHVGIGNSTRSSQ